VKLLRPDYEIIILVKKLKRILRVGYVGEKRNVYRVLVVKTEGKS
jgi:hypothetical protein